MPAPRQSKPAKPRTQRKTYPAEEARGAEIILRTRTERLIFIGGLVSAMAAGVVVVIAGLWLHG